MAGKSLHLCVFVIYAIQTNTGFNIDVQFPVIKEGKTKGSLFGFSVALHKQTEKTKNLLLVGAPQEKAQPNLSKFNINETGAVYYCPVTIEQDDCRRMDLISAPQSTEMVEGMWLGVTVASQRNGGRVLACGHRYVKKLLGAEEQQRMVGKCYVRGNDLTYDPTDYWQSDTYELCDFNYDQDLEGMCNMGISGGMTEKDVYFGTPGSFAWQGTVHMKSRDTNSDFAGDANERSFGKLGDDRFNIYIGYSVLEDMKLLDRSEYTVVTGAPRDNFKGSVMLAEKQDMVLNPLMAIPGEQIGSYFGSCLAVTDLNNDDWNDLIVGAPFYFDRYKEEGGAVYIFMNENGSFQERANLVLKGKKGSGFGFAVAAVGDVNQDGFQDFAVGAPFQDSGKVFIWMGSKTGISKDPSQVIEGKSVGPRGFQTFGYSLSGGMDMDGNDYPDILVGSMDDRVALLRSRPVIHLSKNFTVEPKIVIPSQCVNSCIKVKMCFSYSLSNGNKAFKKDIILKFTVDADQNRRGARVRFLDNKQSTYTGRVFVSAPTCHELELSVNTPVMDKLLPIVFTLNVSLYEEKATAQQTLQNLDDFPVLSGQQIQTDKVEINFHKECGDDNRCISNLQLKAIFADENYIPFPSQTMEFNSNIKKLVMMVDVTNTPDEGKQAEDAHQAMLNITIPPTLKYSGVRTQPGFDIECSADDTIICDLGNPFKSKQKTSLKIIFETSGITLYTEQIESQLQLSTISEQKDLNPVPVTLNVKNTVLTTFSLDKSVIDTSFSGSVIGESAMNSTSDVGSPLEFVFRVKVLGEPLGNLGTLMIDFEWPFAVTNGKWLLYLTEIVIKGATESRCVPPGKIVNHLNLTLSERGNKRSKREVDSAYPHAASVKVLAPRKVPHLLECSKQTAQCLTFSCPLHNMSTQAEIRVRSRVWNGTLLEDYANALRVEVKGKATLRLQADKPAIKMDNQTRDFSVNIDPVLGEEMPYEVPLWIIIVAAVAGILLLGIISLILWKCGFFRRASRREMYEAKSQKAEIKIQPSETERLTEEN
ncbi:integrin alpha-3b isoform X2 [Pimephales promelas]|uniref:integrin alpha-3b isoform X2 n=1 Tax=Pimephales promelas TaxID=90988 RepID=UPI001955702E|nr:integrin alpha-3b isoform X2 [Pimephales promelas]KAG1954636.1 integrin alpha-3 [Pimephales promelas]